MDKYEYKLKLDQMKVLAEKGDYETAAEIADSINWRKVKNINLLIKAGDIYSRQKRYEEAKDILLMAYDRTPLGRMIIYRLAEIAVKMKNIEEAEEYYDEFVEIAPQDNLKYILRYKISRLKGADVKTLITILEELKETEYTEEWAYQLAYLYHKAGESEKCIDACDELILWFGEGIYVERALELKMHYQPLTKAQEDKYRAFKQRRDGIKEVRPPEGASVRIPVVQENVSKFNTANLQEELAKSMQQIMEATKKETVDDTMENIKKMVGDIPYLQVAYKDGQSSSLETDAEIDDSLRDNFKEILAEDTDGQFSIMMKDRTKEPQIDGQMSIEDVLSDWEKTRRAAKSALQMAQQKKLESAKAKALQEAGDIMERLAEVIPKLDAGITPTQLLKEEYLSQDNISDEERASKLMAGMNDMLQQQINKLQEEVKEEEPKPDEPELLRKIKQAKPNFDEQIGLKPYVPRQFEEKAKEESDQTSAEEMLIAEAEFYGIPPEKFSEEDSILLKQETKEIKSKKIIEALDAEPKESVQAEEPKIEESVIKEIKIEEPSFTEKPKIEEPKIEESKLKEQKNDKIQIEKPDINPEEILAKDTTVQKKQKNKKQKKLTEEQKAIFSYFVPVGGMESQICRVLTNTLKKMKSDTSASTGNILIQGVEGSGKTVLAAAFVKALQKELKRPKGKMGKIDAKVLNKKDLTKLVQKIAGGYLIIEHAGDISRETAVKLSLLLENDTSGILVIMEDTRTGLNQAMGQDEGLSKKFTERVIIPIFTSDELVEFGKAYAHDLDYEIDTMGVLALYNRISNIQRLDRATNLTEVKEIVDKAIKKAEKNSIKKAISIITSRRYTEDDYIILREKDFEE